MSSSFKIQGLALYTALAISSLGADCNPCQAATGRDNPFRLYPASPDQANNLERAKFIPVFRQLRESDLTPVPKGPINVLPYTEMADSDAGCALSCVRVHLERRLTALAAPTCDGVMPEGINDLLAHLQLKRILNSRQVLALQRLTSLLNEAVHGLRINSPEVSLWIKEESPRLLVSLENLLIRRL